MRLHILCCANFVLIRIDSVFSSRLESRSQYIYSVRVGFLSLLPFIFSTYPCFPSTLDLPSFAFLVCYMLLHLCTIFDIRALAIAVRMLFVLTRIYRIMYPFVATTSSSLGRCRFVRGCRIEIQSIEPGESILHAPALRQRCC